MGGQSGYATFFVSPFAGGDCDEVNRFLRSHRIVGIDKRPVDGERGTGWMFLIEYLQEGSSSAQRQTGQRVDYREKLPPEEFAVFDTLRRLRKHLAETHGVPVYAVFSNEQLAAMARLRPDSRTALMRIDGIGEAKASQYGDAFLQVLRDQAKPEQASGG